MAIYKLFDGAEEPSEAARSHFQGAFASHTDRYSNSDEVDFFNALRLRCVLFLGSFLAVLWAAMAAALSFTSLCFGTLLLLISLGTRRSGLSLASRCWRHARLASACALGCTVSLFSLKFGLTILAIYFLLRSEEHQGQGVMGYVCQQVNEAFSRFGVS